MCSLVAFRETCERINCPNIVTNQCAQCAAGYFGGSCSGICPGGIGNECSGNGTCSDGISGNGLCTCHPGYAGPACQYSNAATCNGNGTASYTGACSCDTGFTGSDCSQCDADYYDYPNCVYCSDATSCSGNGTCASNGSCFCEGGFSGSNCGQCSINYYDYPTCRYCHAFSSCSGNGTCDGDGYCECSSGYGANCTDCSTACPQGTGTNATGGSPCSSADDRICAPCDAGTFNDGGSLDCAACDTCSPGTFAGTPCAPGSNTQCDACADACDLCNAPGPTGCLSCATDHIDYLGECIVVAPQDKDQQKCLKALNKGLFKVAKTQIKEIYNCIKNAATAGETDPDGCLTRDSKSKIAKAKAKLATDQQERCTLAPDFGELDAAVVGGAATDQVLALAADVVGSSLNTTAVGGMVTKQVTTCQAAVVKAYDKVTLTAQKAFLKCKKRGLKSGGIDSALALGACTAATATDRKVLQAGNKIGDAVLARCADVDLADAFPGTCSAAADFATCAFERVKCRTCRMFNSGDNLREDCDLFDDGTANLSCSE